MLKQYQGRHLNQCSIIFGNYYVDYFYYSRTQERRGENNFGLISVCHRAQTFPLVNGHDALEN